MGYADCNVCLLERIENVCFRLSKNDYLAQVGLAARRLIQERYLLAEDVDGIMQQAAQHYDALASLDTSFARARYPFSSGGRRLG